MLGHPCVALFGEPTFPPSLSPSAPFKCSTPMYQPCTPASRSISNNLRLDGVKHPNFLSTALSTYPFPFMLRSVKLAAAVAMNDDLARAEILHREALSIMERTLPRGDPRFAEVLFNLSAVVGGQRGRLGETENILHRCLEAQKRLYGMGESLFSVVYHCTVVMRLVSVLWVMLLVLVVALPVLSLLLLLPFPLLPLSCGGCLWMFFCRRPFSR